MNRIAKNIVTLAATAALALTSAAAWAVRPAPRQGSRHRPHW